jgi:hypothetical protein
VDLHAQAEPNIQNLILQYSARAAEAKIIQMNIKIDKLKQAEEANAKFLYQYLHCGALQRHHVAPRINTSPNMPLSSPSTIHSPSKQTCIYRTTLDTEYSTHSLAQQIS